MEIVILDQDAQSRCALEQLLKAQELDGACVVVARREALCEKESAECVYLLVRHAAQHTAEASALKQTDQFVFPFRAGQLLDRIHRYRAAHADQCNQPDTFPIGRYTLDISNCEWLDPGGRPPVRLTDKERHILVFLAKQKGAFVSRETLLREVWGYVESVETHTLETHIYRLRQKIEKDPTNPTLLITDEKGYRLSV